MGPLIEWLMSLCECCYADCDCGCVLDCPRHRSKITDHMVGGRQETPDTEIASAAGSV